MPLSMPLIVVFLVHMVSPFLGSLLTPTFVFREEAGQRDTQQGQADGQGDQAFHVGLLSGFGNRKTFGFPLNGIRNLTGVTRRF
jgi:hypothetical protein